jgi:hypothetical protein
MKLRSDESIRSHLEPKIHLPESIAALGASYKSAAPFPHLVIDGLFPEAQLDRLADEIPPPGAASWVRENNAQLNKFNLRSAIELGETGFQLVAFLHSAAFLYFLSEITGIWGLLPDPYLQGSGYHIVPRGGKFAIHYDRNTDFATGLARRFALIVYLNKDWKHEYGGQLELWNSDATRCEAVVEPIFNRTIIFEIADHNYHGHPTPVACPEGRTRNSFAVYYHTVGVDGTKDLKPHHSVYAPSFYLQKQSAFRQIIKDIAPPILLRRFRGSQNGK